MARPYTIRTFTSGRGSSNVTLPPGARPSAALIAAALRIDSKSSTQQCYRDNKTPRPPKWTGRTLSRAVELAGNRVVPDGGCKLKKWSLALLGVFLVAALAVAAFALRTPPPPPPASDAVANYTAPPPPPDLPVAIMFGDSYFNGWGGVPRDYALGHSAARQLGYLPVIRGGGATGYVTARTDGKAGAPLGAFLDQIKDAPLDKMKPAALIVLQGGLADLDAQPGTFTEGMREMIRTVKAQQPTARIVVLGPPNITPRVERSGNDQLQATVAAEEGVTYIPFETLAPVDELRAMIGPDKTHPTPEANKILVERLAAELVRLGVPDMSAAS